MGKRCEAILKNKKRCENEVKPGYKFCAKHIYLDKDVQFYKSKKNRKEKKKSKYTTKNIIPTVVSTVGLGATAFAAAKYYTAIQKKEELLKKLKNYGVDIENGTCYAPKNFKRNDTQPKSLQFSTDKLPANTIFLIFDNTKEKRVVCINPEMIEEILEKEKKEFPLENIIENVIELDVGFVIKDNQTEKSIHPEEVLVSEKDIMKIQYEYSRDNINVVFKFNQIPNTNAFKLTEEKENIEEKENRTKTINLFKNYGIDINKEKIYIPDNVQRGKGDPSKHILANEITRFENKVFLVFNDKVTQDNKVLGIDPSQLDEVIKNKVKILSYSLGNKIKKQYIVITVDVREVKDSGIRCEVVVLPEEEILKIKEKLKEDSSVRVFYFTQTDYIAEELYLLNNKSDKLSNRIIYELNKTNPGVEETKMEIDDEI